MKTVPKRKIGTVFLSCGLKYAVYPEKCVVCLVLGKSELKWCKIQTSKEHRVLDKTKNNFSEVKNMAFIYLEASSLSEKANELEALNEHLLIIIENLNDYEANLSSMWEGEAKEAFRTAYQRDAIQMKNFYNAIFLYVAQLRVIIERYRQREMLNTQTAATRTYC